MTSAASATLVISTGAGTVARYDWTFNVGLPSATIRVFVPCPNRDASGTGPAATGTGVVAEAAQLPDCCLKLVAHQYLFCLSEYYGIFVWELEKTPDA